MPDGFVAENDDTTAAQTQWPMHGGQVLIVGHPMPAALLAARLQAEADQAAWEQQQDLADQQGVDVDGLEDLAKQLQKRKRARQQYDSKQHLALGPIFAGMAETRVDARPRERLPLHC